MVSLARRDMFESMTKSDPVEPKELTFSRRVKGHVVKVHTVEVRACAA